MCHCSYRRENKATSCARNHLVRGFSASEVVEVSKPITRKFVPLNRCAGKANTSAQASTLYLSMGRKDDAQLCSVGVCNIIRESFDACVYLLGLSLSRCDHHLRIELRASALASTQNALVHKRDKCRGAAGRISGYGLALLPFVRGCTELNRHAPPPPQP